MKISGKLLVALLAILSLALLPAWHHHPPAQTGSPTSQGDTPCAQCAAFAGFEPPHLADFSSCPLAVAHVLSYAPDLRPCESAASCITGRAPPTASI